MAEPVLDDPAGGHELAQRQPASSAAASSWTPVTIDTTTNTVYFGTGSATPLYFPALAARLERRAPTRSIAVNLAEREA